MKNKMKAIEGRIKEMDFNGDYKYYISDREIGILQGAGAVIIGYAVGALGIVQETGLVLVGITIGALIVMAGNKQTQKFEKDDDES